MNTQFNSNVIWLQLEYKISTLGHVLKTRIRFFNQWDSNFSNVLCSFRLASHPRIHFICSSDHVNAPLLWDQHKLSNFNFVWQDASTFLPYFEETLNENSLMVRSGGTKLALHSLMRVCKIYFYRFCWLEEVGSRISHP